MPSELSKSKTASDPEFRSRLIKGLKKNPNAFFSELADTVSTASDLTTLKTELKEFSRLHEKELALQDERKALSRKIGPAKRNNENYQPLIAGVAEISTKLSDINSAINAQVAMISTLINHNDVPSRQTSETLPLHLLLPTDHQTKPSSMAGSFTLSHDDSLDLNEWQEFVKKTPHATIYHDAIWKNIVNRSFNHELHHIVCRDGNNQLIGVLPLSHLKSKLFGSFTLSMPYVNYGGPLAHSLEIEEALLNYASGLSNKLGCSHMEIRETRTRNGWKSVQRKVSMILPLPSSDSLLDSRLGSKLRAQVNKAKSNNLVVKFGALDLLDDFYYIFSRNMRDLGTPVYSKTIFKEILSGFPDNAFIAIVYQADQPLAAGFLLGFRDKLEIPWASSLKDRNHLGANMYMYRSILAEAINRQYQFFDFGRSTIGASTHKFKKQWGAQEHQLHWHYWTREDRDVPEINPDNQKYKLVIGIWKKLPVFITQLLGPGVARNLP